MIASENLWFAAGVEGGLGQIDLTGSDLGTGRGLLVATGGHRAVMEELHHSLGDHPIVDLEFKHSGVVITPHTTYNPVQHRIAHVLTSLRFDENDIDRIHDQIAQLHPDIVVISGRTSTSHNDIQWATAIADRLDPPTILALDTDQPTTWQQMADTVRTHQPAVDLYAAVPYSHYEAAPSLNLYEATGVRRFDDAPLAASATAQYAPMSIGDLVSLASGGGSDIVELPGVAAPPPAPRYVNTLLSQADSGAVVAPQEALAVGAAYRLGIGIGPKDPNSILKGGNPFPDDAFPTRQARRVDVYLQAARGDVDQLQLRHLYLPSTGAAFTCPYADTLPVDTDWASFEHSACSAGHRDLAEFAMPGLPGLTTLELEVLLYVGAALIHRQKVELSTVPGRGCKATATFQLLHTFEHVPDLTDRRFSVAEGFDHLTVNKIGAGTFTFALADAQWSAAAFDVRTALTDSHFERKQNDGQVEFVARHQLGQTTQEQFEGLLHQLATSGHALLNAVFRTPETRGLVPMLRHEAEGRDRPPVVQIARTVQRRFVLPWQVLYDLPLNPRKKQPDLCESVREYGPAQHDWRPPPAVCPHADTHPTDPRASFLCPWGFWGLAYLLEVPEPVEGREVSEFVAEGAAANQVLAAAGAGLIAAELEEHLANLRDDVPGFPATHLTEAEALLEALAKPSDVVYVLCHNEDADTPGRGSALTFTDGPLMSDEIAEWARDEWPSDHWSERRPLVVLNACRTAEMLQSTMSGYVSNFTGAGAAGVVGTETMIDQPSASEAMQHFLTEFARGASVSEALRYARWRLLAKGSLLGLTYSPYCSAALRLRPNNRGEVK